MDPIGTVRRKMDDQGASVWVRMDPGYPDNEFADTEYTCISSTIPGVVAARLGARVVEQFPAIGAVPGTPAAS